MPELKYIITADDKEVRKTLARLSKDVSKDLTSAAGGMTAEVEKTNRKTKEAVVLINKETEALRKRNNEAAKAPKRTTTFEAYKPNPNDVYRPDRTGSAVGNHAALGAQANAANSASVAQTKLTTATKATTVANKAQSLSIEEVRAKLLLLKEQQLLATDPAKRVAYNKHIQATSIELGRMENVGKKGFDSMGNAIKGSSGMLGKFWSGLKMAANILPGIGIAGLLAFAVGPIVEYISKLDLFKTKVSDADKVQTALVEKMGEVGAASAKAAIDVDLMKQKFDQARAGVISKSSALKEYNEGIGKTLGVTNDLNIAEERVIKNGDAYVALMFKKAEAAAYMTLYQEKMAKAAEELAKTDSSTGDYIMSGTKGKGIKNAKGEDIYEANARRNREAAAKPFKDEANAIKNLIIDKNNDIAKFANKNKLILDPVEVKSTKSLIATENKYQSALAKRLDLINTIKAASADATAKNLTEEDSELAASEAKYAKMRQDIQEFNKWAENYNKNNLKKISLVDVGVVDGIEQTDRDAILDARARKQYEHYQELYNSTLSHNQRIEAIEKEHQEKLAELSGNQNGKVTPEQAAELQAQTDAKIDAVRDEAFQKTEIYKQLNEDISYYTKEELKVQIATIEEFLKNASGIPAELRERLAGQLENAKGNLGKSGDDAYVDGLKKQKAALLEYLSKSKLSTAEYQKQLDKLKQINLELQKAASVKFSKLSGDLGAISGAASELAGAFKDVDSSISDVLSKMSEFSAVGGSAAGALASFAQGPTGIISGITQSISAIGGIIKLISGDRAQQKKELAAYYQNIFTGEHEYARMMRARQSIQENITELTIKELEARKQMLSGQGGDALKDYNETLAKIQSLGEEFQKLREGNVYKFAGTADKNKIDDGLLLDTSDYDALEKLHTESRMADKAKALFEELRKSKEEMDALGKSTKEADEVLTKIRTGTTASDLSNTLMDMFKNGKTGVQDFADFFEKTMQDAFFSTFQSDVLNQSMKEWYAEFDEASKGGLTDEERFQLETSLQNRAAADKLKFDQMASVAGVDLNKANGANSGLQGTIRRELTESTASELTGLFRGQFDVTKRLLAATSDGFTKSNDIAMSGIRHLQAIEVNTANTVGRLDLVVSRLDAVVINTKPTTTGRGLGLVP